MFYENRSVLFATTEICFLQPPALKASKDENQTHPDGLSKAPLPSPFTAKLRRSPFRYAFKFSSPPPPSHVKNSSSKICSSVDTEHSLHTHYRRQFIDAHPSTPPPVLVNMKIVTFPSLLSAPFAPPSADTETRAAPGHVQNVDAKGLGLT